MISPALWRTGHSPLRHTAPRTRRLITDQIGILANSAGIFHIAPAGDIHDFLVNFVSRFEVNETETRIKTVELGFYDVTPATRQTWTALTGTETLLALIGRVNELAADLEKTGIIDVT